MLGGAMDMVSTAIASAVASSFSSSTSSHSGQQSSGPNSTGSRSGASKSDSSSGGGIVTNSSSSSSSHSVTTLPPSSSSFSSSMGSSAVSSSSFSNASGSGSGSGSGGESGAVVEHSALIACLLVLFKLGLVFGPNVGYVFQYFNIRETNNIDGYSPIVSIILLVSNTIRIFYYPGERFALTLLFQAFAAVATHCLLLYKVLRVFHDQSQEATESRVLDYLSGISSYDPVPAPGQGTNNSGDGKPGRRRGSGAAATTTATSAAMMDAGGQPARGAGSGSYNIELGAAGGGGGATDSPTNELSFSDGGENPVNRYGVCIGGLMNILNAICDSIESRFTQLMPQEFLFKYGASAIIGFFSVLILFALSGFARGLVSFVGYVALGIEATLAIPQILRNARRRSTEGLTVVLVVSWVGGDVVKIIYFFVASQPLPFILCGFFQLSLDAIVVYQYVLYRAQNAAMNTMFPTTMV